MPATAAVDRCDPRRRAVPTEHQEPSADRAQHHDRDRPLVVRRVVLPARRVAVDREHGEPEHDHDCAADLATPDALVRQQPAEREREDDRGHEQRLDDREPAAVERARLEHVADEQRRGAEQPHALADEPYERHRVRERDSVEVEGALLLERRGDREQEGRHECERGRHRAISLRQRRDGVEAGFT